MSGTFSFDEQDGLAFVQFLHSAAFERGVVEEQISAIASNRSKAPVGEKFLDGTFCCGQGEIESAEQLWRELCKVVTPYWPRVIARRLTPFVIHAACFQCGDELSVSLKEKISLTAGNPQES